MALPIKRHSNRAFSLDCLASGMPCGHPPAGCPGPAWSVQRSSALCHVWLVIELVSIRAAWRSFPLLCARTAPSGPSDELRVALREAQDACAKANREAERKTLIIEKLEADLAALKQTIAKRYAITKTGAKKE